MNPAFSTAGDPETAVTEDVDTDTTIASSVQRIADNPRARKHAELLGDLLYSFDALIYVELSVLYYLDCAFSLLILRTLVQLFFLTERPPGLPSPPSRPALGAVIGSNLLCTFSHLLNKRPEAFEATRFYLHGSLLIDFVGQLGPTSKWRLFALDVLVLVLQVIVMGLGIEKRKSQTAEKEIPGSTQDLEAEEAGMIRSESVIDEVHESDDGIEMQELMAEMPVDDRIGRDDANTHPLDEFYTGNTLLVRANLIETIARDVASATTASEATSGGVSLPGLFLRWRSLG